MQTQDLQGNRWEVNNFSNTVWEAAIWMHHFFQVRTIAIAMNVDVLGCRCCVELLWTTAESGHIDG